MEINNHNWRVWLRAVAQVSVCLGAVTIGLIWLSVSFHLAVERVKSEQAAIQNSGNLARAFEEHLTRLIGEVDRLLLTLGTNYERDPTTFDLTSWNKDTYLTDGPAIHIGIVGPDGFLKINSAGPLQSPVDLSSTETFWFHFNASDDELFISKPAIGRVSGKWSIQVSRRLSKPGGSFDGVISVALDPYYFVRFYDSIDVGRNGYVAIVGSDGVVRAVGGRTVDALGRNLVETQLLKRALLAPAGWYFSEHTRSDGIKRLVSYHTVKGFPLIVKVGIAEQEIFAEHLSKKRSYSAAAMAMTLVILLVMGLSISGRVKLERARKTLHTRNAQFDAALNNMSQGLLLFNSESRLVLHNQRYLQMYGLSPEKVKPGCTLRDLLQLRKAAGTFAGDPDKYADKFVDEAGKFMGDPDIAKFGDQRVETKVIELPDGRTISITNQAMRGGGWVSTHDDITERRRAEQERDRNREFLDLIIENAPAPIFVKDASERRYVLVNRAGERFWGASRAEMIGKTSHEVFPKEEADLIATRDEQLLQSDQPLFDERQICTPHNGIRSIVSRRLIVRDSGGKPRYVVGVIEDVTERKRAEERIAHLADHDALTDLPNRRHFAEKLEQALKLVQRGKRLAILYIDLDYFKRVNDTLGHAIGDEVLKDVADRLRGCVREIDAIARLSGDEFAIIQTSLEQPSDAAALAMRIREAIKAPYNLNGHSVVVDSSIGISIAPNDSTKLDELLKTADIALYEAKTSGRGTYCFYEPELDARIKARSKLELDLRKALVNGEFALLYQPVVNLQNNKISACEALLRWHHPERGVLSPAEFIPIAEEIGIITQLGEWVLRTACAEAATWPDDIKAAVNFSPAQLTSNNPLQVVVSALAASGVPAHRLELEITESVLMKNTFATLTTLHQLRELGVQIAMGDFGTGHSSLSYLLSFPFNKIKIDRCFIKDLADRDNSRTIVRAVARLATSLGMTTTAEGVETQQQLEQIRLLGCTEMQGYFFSPPIPAAEISQLFLSRAESIVSAA